MENEEEKVVVKEIIREVPAKEKRKITIKFPGPIKILIYALIIFILLGGSIFGIKTIFKSQEKVLKLGLDDVGELVTQTCHTVVLEDSKESASFFNLFDIPFTESRQIFSYDFDVDASIDFSKIEITEIDNKIKLIKISMPNAKIYKVTAIQDSFKSYLDSDGLFTRIDLTEHNDALLRMEEDAKNQCIESDLLNRANTNAQNLITSMIKSNKDFKEYRITYYYRDDVKEEQGK